MSRAHVTTHHEAAGQLHFEVHRSALAEAGADAALGLAWILFWLVFLLALAPPAPTLGFGGSADGQGASTQPAQDLRGSPDRSAQPGPGPSGRGVAPVERAGAT